MEEILDKIKRMDYRDLQAVSDAVSVFAKQIKEISNGKFEQKVWLR